MLLKRLAISGDWIYLCEVCWLVTLTEWNLSPIESYCVPNIASTSFCCSVATVRIRIIGCLELAYLRLSNSYDRFQNHVRHILKHTWIIFFRKLERLLKTVHFVSTSPRLSYHRTALDASSGIQWYEIKISFFSDHPTTLRSTVMSSKCNGPVLKCSPFKEIPDAHIYGSGHANTSSLRSIGRILFPTNPISVRI